MGHRRATVAHWQVQERRAKSAAVKHCDHSMSLFRTSPYNESWIQTERRAKCCWLRCCNNSEYFFSFLDILADSTPAGSYSTPLCPCAVNRIEQMYFVYSFNDRNATRRGGFTSGSSSSTTGRSAALPTAPVVLAAAWLKGSRRGQRPYFHCRSAGCTRKTRLATQKKKSVAAFPTKSCCSVVEFEVRTWEPQSKHVICCISQIHQASGHSKQKADIL